MGLALCASDCCVARSIARQRLNCRSVVLLAITALVAVTAFPLGAARAQDATWLAAPATGDFNTATNWTPATVPTGTAFFGTSSTTALTFSALTSIGGWTFNAGASTYSFTDSNQLILFNGAGIVINGGSAAITVGASGTLIFSATSTAGSATITNTGLTLFFLSSTAGSATIGNTGTLSFDNTSTAANASITNSSSLNFNNSSTAGNASITNNNNLTFNNNSTAGNAAITNNGGGVVDFSASTGPAGDNKLSAGSIAGAGAYLLGANELTVGANNMSTAVSGVISGTPGSLVKAGTGTLTLSGINTYTGPTTVNAGTLAVNGSIAPSVLTTVNAGGTLGGNGIVGNTMINGGALAPVGLLTVNGNLTFTAASSYMVGVSPATADRTNVTGTATLGGATVNASFAPGAYVAKQYTILNATGGVGGTFAGPVNTNLPANFTSSLSYDANDAYLNLMLGFVPPAGGGGLNENQRNVASAIIGFFNATGGIPAAFGGLTPAGLTQISGELATAPQQTTFDAMNMFLGILTDPFIVGRGDPVSGSSGALPYAGENDRANAYAADDKARTKSEQDAYAAIYRKAPGKADPFAQRWSVWAAVYGGSQTTDGNATVGSNNATSRIAGGVVGADYRFSPNTIAGFALAGGGTNFSVANGLGSGRSDLFQFGAFVRHNVGPAYLVAALAYGWQDITTDRTVTVAGTDQLHAKFNANAWSGRVESGYRFVEPGLAIGITPYAAGQFTTFDLPAYAEQAVSGTTTFALDYGAKSVTDSRSELGLRGDKSFAMQDGIFTLRGRAAWAHDFNPDRNIGATFQTLPGASFIVNGAAQAPDAALVTASADMKWRNGWSTAVAFEGGFSNVTASYAGKGVARYTW
jgi:autotransporter-associated beta strand protein